MKRARILVLIIAVVAAGAAALIARNMVSGPQETRIVERRVDTTDVLVAAKDIGLGDAINSGDVQWQEWPKGAATTGYVTKATEPNAPTKLSGSIARAPFLKGEPIKSQKLIRASEGGIMAAILPSGMRAVSTPIREETAAGGFILPNDRVDVIMTRQARNGNRDDYVSDTVLQNVRVLAIGQSIETKNNEKVATGKTATLELTPRQAEVLTLARSSGDISLALRSLSDSNPDAAASLSEDALGRSKGGTVKVLKYNVPSQAFGVN